MSKTRFWLTGLQTGFESFLLPILAGKAKRAVKGRFQGPKFLTPKLLPDKIRLALDHGAPTSDATQPPQWLGHRRVQRIVVIHAADKAGPHIDYHLVDESLGLYSSFVVRIKFPLRTNSKGYLTEASKSDALEMLRQELDGSAFVAQSKDHTAHQSRTQWHNHAITKGYGAGELREVIQDGPVDLFKSGNKLQLKDWWLNPHQETYFYRVFPGDEQKKTPIWVAGFKKPENPKLEDRLHLKMDTDPDKFRRLVGDGHYTVKEDGASAYMVSNPNGTRFYSPRISKKTGVRIDYTARLGSARHLDSAGTVSGMGELLLYRRGKELKAHEIGGLLNRHAPLPEDVDVKFTLYRIDRVGRQKVTGESYGKQLERIREVVERDTSGTFRMPTIIQPDQIEGTRHLEGVVGIPKEGHINGHGRKLKWRDSEVSDWRVERVHLSPGSNGGIQGVVHFRSLGSGKLYKMGAGALGTDSQCRSMMSFPEKYEGRVAKVRSMHGHEGRAAILVDWHSDKGEGD